MQTVESLIVGINDVAARPMTEARSLPPAVYSSSDLYDVERREILKRDWFCVGRTTDFRKSGDYLATEYAGEPLLIWRGADDKIRAFSNVCRHRSSILRPNGMGSGKAISCPYHAWTYNSDGSLRTAPHTGKEFPTENICLPEFLVETWNGFVFVNFDRDAEPLSPQLKGIDAKIGDLNLADFKWSAQLGEKKVKANWKMMLENGQDGYHLFAVHKQTLSPNVSRTESSEGGLSWSVSVEPRGQPWEAFDDDPKSWTDKHRIMTQTFAIFPTLLFSVDVHCSVWFALFPISETETLLRTGVAARSEDRLRPIGGNETMDEKSFSEWDWELLREDTEVVEGIQRGSTSEYARQGKLVAELEGNLIDFHRYLARRLIPAAMTNGLGG